MSPRRQTFAALRVHHLLLISLCLIAICTVSILRPHVRALRDLATLRTLSFRTSCVLVMGKQNNEGIGQTLLRNQFAVFVAEILSSKLNFPEHMSHHGYNLADFFDRCASSPHARNNSTPTVPERCVLRKKQLLMRNCRRGDCECLRRETMRHVRPLATRCDIIGVQHDSFKTLEYAGCISNVMTRYFGGPNRWRKAYNAVHYRQGDLKEKHDANDNWMYMLNNMISFMCRHSERDIVIVTQGEPEVPKCEDRVVLAGNTSERESFAILQHAQWIGVENSGFGIAMMQIAKPERVLMDTFVTKWYDWLIKPEWTVFNRAGAVFSFASGRDAIEAKYAGAGLEVRTLRGQYLKKYDRFVAEVPARRWEKEALGAAQIKTTAAV
eukprot:TRINITY_DN1034_c0_g1_i1.p1 TRINITY_DN1034_c0_g1~~TRINITY_DN1034_c0_g1_i1.p1  ORF type:complete len:382 (+),score=52.34 TRINITY_DN1034_c0_g1_i1:135-1280(+)